MYFTLLINTEYQQAQELRKLFIAGSEELEMLHRALEPEIQTHAVTAFTGIAGDRSVAQDLAVREIQPQRSLPKGCQLRV